jgi:hypothetical protein
VLAGLAEEKPDFLQGLRKNVFARHDECSSAVLSSWIRISQLSVFALVVAGQLLQVQAKHWLKVGDEVGACLGQHKTLMHKWRRDSCIINCAAGFNSEPPRLQHGATNLRGRRHLTSFLSSLQSPLYLSSIFDKQLVAVKEGAFKYPASTSAERFTYPRLCFTKLNTMPAPSQLLRAARPAFRSQFFTSQLQSSRTGFKSKFGGRRWQSTASPAAQPSWFKRMWDSPIGLKTVHFWFVPVLLSGQSFRLVCTFYKAD